MMLRQYLVVLYLKKQIKNLKILVILQWTNNKFQNLNLLLCFCQNFLLYRQIFHHCSCCQSLANLNLQPMQISLHSKRSENGIDINYWGDGQGNYPYRYLLSRYVFWKRFPAFNPVGTELPAHFRHFLSHFSSVLDLCKRAHREDGYDLSLYSPIVPLFFCK